MTLTIGQNYFVDLNPEWFNEQYENAKNEYEYSDEPYSYYIDDVVGHLNLSLAQDFDQVRVKIQYMSGNESVTDAVKGFNEDILFYDLDRNVWKHRYTIMVRPLTERGVEIFNKALEFIQSTPSFMEIDEDVKLVGEIQENVEDCITCRKGK